MNLQELKITTYIYNQFTRYDENYIEIKDINFSFQSEEEIESLIQFLRDWQCRQFKKPTERETINSFIKWYDKYSMSLPANEESLLNLSDEEILNYASVFQELMDCHASTKIMSIDNSSSIARFGPVGAAKALFALRKNAFAPWDNYIIDKLNERNSYPDAPISKDGLGYCHYLIYVKRELQSLANEGVDLFSLPVLLDRPFSSLPKIIDEHLWVSITGRIDPKEIIRRTTP